MQIFASLFLFLWVFSPLALAVSEDDKTPDPITECSKAVDPAPPIQRFSTLNTADISVKLYLNDITTLPKEVVTALQTGAQHSDILRRGFVVLEYLPVDPDNESLKLFFEKINATGVPFGSPSQQQAFFEPGAVKEIRMMSRSIKIGEKRVELFQATVKGAGDLVVDLLETPENITSEQAEKVRLAFSELRPKVTDQARKAYGEIVARNAKGIPILKADGSGPRTVELDLFIGGGKDNPRLKFFKGEVKFRASTNEAAIAEAKQWRGDVSQWPPYLSKARDITDFIGAKTRNIAQFGMPGMITREMDPFRTKNEEIFRKILAEFQSWSRPEVAELAFKVIQPATEIKEFPFFNFLYSLAKTRDLHEAVRALERKYDARDLKTKIPLLGKYLFLLKSRERVTQVMKARTSLPFANRDFSVAAGLKHSINDVNAGERLWEDLHYGLLEIFNNKKITPIMEKHKEILTGSGKVSLNKTLEDYFLRVWGEYMFGEIDAVEFGRIRNLLVDTLGKAFHKSELRGVPVLGRIAARVNNFRYRSEWKEVNDGLSGFLKSAIAQKKGAFYELYAKLEASNYPNAFDIALENSFLGCLVYDFIHIVLLDATVNIAKFPGLERKPQVMKSMRTSFLYPKRGRIALEDFGEVKKGDYCVVDLKEAGLIFSGGPRTCSGARLFGEIHTTFLRILSDYDLKLLDPEQTIQTTGNENTPFMISEHEATITKKSGGCPFTALRGALGMGDGKGCKEP